MKIGVISDSHDRLPTLQRAVSMFTRLGVDAILHAGDYVAPFAAQCLTPKRLGQTPVYGIYGNNDGEREGLQKMLPQLVDGPLRIELGGKTIVMHHFYDWFEPQDTKGADVIISGHDHKALIEDQQGQLLLNPGECCGWLTGRCTVALLDLETVSAELIEVRG